MVRKFYIMKYSCAEDGEGFAYDSSRHMRMASTLEIIWEQNCSVGSGF